MDIIESNFSSFYNLKFKEYLNFSFNSTVNYEDPLIIFLNAVTSDTATYYFHIGVYIILFILFVLPAIGTILFQILNNGVAFGIFVVYKYFHCIDKNTARNAILDWWYWIGKIWFGYELIGIEHLPTDGPIMIVTMHGIFPAFVPCVVAIFARNHRNFHYIIDKKTANSTILKEFFQLFNFGAWSRDECIKILNDGNEMAIMPGGSYEMRHSDSNYRVDWGNRKGYCEVARQAEVPIYPAFCINLLEAFWTPFFIKPFTQGRFSSKRFPLYFCWGALPVKLISVIGKPIHCDKLKTIDEIHEECLDAIRLLRDSNQRLPGNKFYALIDRFRKIKPKNNLLNTTSNTSTIV